MRATLITSCYTVCGDIGKEVRSSTEASQFPGWLDHLEEPFQARLMGDSRLHAEL